MSRFDPVLVRLRDGIVHHRLDCLRRLLPLGLVKIEFGLAAAARKSSIFLVQLPEDWI
jgi:hypothetical protein